MRQRDVLEHTRRQPFEPFRIVLSAGRSYDVRHPDMCIAGQSALYVGVTEPDAAEAAARVDHVSLYHVVRFERINGRSEDKPAGHRGK